MPTADDLIKKELDRKIKPGGHSFGTDYAVTKAAALAATDPAPLIASHNTDEAAHSTEFGNKAAKTASVAASNAAATSAPAANVQTGSYVQADVESIRTLANDLQTQYDGSVTLINELKTKMDTMNA